jgi:curved DNA-binding protein CbpA
MNGSENPYDILGVSPDADEVAIKKAYRQAARIHHPDKQTTDEDRERATAYFAKIADAYSLLQDPVRRYDWRMSHGDKLKRSLQKSSSPSKSTKSTATMKYRVPSTSLKRQSTPYVSMSGPKIRSSNQNPSSSSKSTKSTAAMNYRVPSTSLKRQSTPYVSASGPRIRSSNQTTVTTPSTLRRHESSVVPRLRVRPSINTTECKQSPSVARKPAVMKKPMISSSLGGNTIPQRSMTNKKNRSPRPEAGRKKRRSQSVPSTNKKLEWMLSGASTESKRKGRTAARPDLDVKSQHPSKTVKSEQVPKKTIFGRARNLMRGFNKRSVSVDNSSSTISMRSADNSISIRQ